MKKQILWLLPVLIFLSLFDAMARDLRTPYGLDRGPFHYPIPCRPTDEEQCWNIDIWGAGLHRQANTAFIDKNSFSTDDSLAGIIFGRDSFVGLDAFAPGTIAPQNPFLAFAQITPKIRYSENSAYFGMYIERQLPWGCDCAWRGGMRMTLPYRAIEVALDCCDPEEKLEDVCRRQDENVTDGTVTNLVTDCYTYRMDFLSALFVTQAGPNPDRLVQYNNNPALKIVPVNNVTETNGTLPNPVFVTQRDDTTAPQGNYCMINTPNGVAGLPFLAPDGSGVANDASARFESGTGRYVPLSNDSVQLRELWLRPTAQNNGGNIQMSNNARDIGNQINTIVEKMNKSALNFFEDHGVTLDPQHLEGLGQMVFEFYANRDWCDWFFEGIVGFNAPTGNKVKNPGEVYKIFNTGNNRHWGVKVGGIATYDPKVWFHLRASTFYTYNVPKTERVAAPFAGATIKNIGPAVDAKISWHQWVGRLDTVWLVPCNPRVGALFGYEAYIKTKDKVSLSRTTATDFLGNTQPLDANVLERRTKVYSHKFRSEIFHQGSFWELFAGWTHVFAGRNAPKETDWHLGLIAFF